MKTTTNATGRKPKPKPPVPPEVKADPKTTITYSCNHKALVHLLQGSICPGCKHARQREKKKAAIAKEKEKLFRLPDKAVFSLTFDAKAGVWQGTLEAGGKVYQGHAAGVHTLIVQLGNACHRGLTTAGS